MILDYARKLVLSRARMKRTKKKKWGKFSAEEIKVYLSLDLKNAWLLQFSFWISTAFANIFFSCMAMNPTKILLNRPFASCCKPHYESDWPGAKCFI